MMRAVAGVSSGTGLASGSRAVRDAGKERVGASLADTAMQLGANHPMGPLQLADYIGLDIVHAMAENLYKSFKQEYMAPPDTLKMLVTHECLGRKSKLGFYDYSHSPAKPNPALKPLHANE